MICRFVTIAMILLVAACASGPAPIPPEAPAAKRGSSAGATPAVTAPTKPVAGTVSSQGASAPVDALLDEARRFRKSGDLPLSFARLERALRIAPRRAEVYLELARNHYAAGNPERAAASAERGLLYCDGRSCRELRRFLGN